jgi:plastocyanin
LETSCQEATALLLERTLSVLEDDARVRLDEHLRLCEECRERVPAIDGALEDWKSAAPEKPAPADSWERIRAHLGDAPAPEVRVVLVCTWCKGGLERHEAAYCATCLAPCHADCFATHGRCPAPGCDETRVVQPRTLARPRHTQARPRRVAPFVVALVLGTGAAVAALSPPHPRRELPVPSPLGRTNGTSVPPCLRVSPNSMQLPDEPSERALVLEKLRRAVEDRVTNFLSETRNQERAFSVFADSDGTIAVAIAPPLDESPLDRLRDDLGVRGDLRCHFVKEDASGPGIDRLERGTDTVFHLQPEVALANDDIERAYETMSSSGTRAIGLKLTAEGGARFYETTRGNLGRKLAILLDGEVVSAPVIRSAIGQECVIEGRFSEKDAHALIGALAPKDRYPLWVWVQRETPGVLKQTPATIPDVVTDDTPGSLRGRVFLKAHVERPAPVEVAKDHEVCGAVYRDESLVVAEDGALANVVVYLVGVPTPTTWDRRGTYRIDQKECRFTPRILLAPVGEKVTIGNSDPICHDVKSNCVANPTFNELVAASGALTRTFANAEFVRLGCAMHPFMGGTIVVMEHPWYAVTSASGAFTLPDIPPGTYKVMAWHETLGRALKWGTTVTIEPGAHASLDITF